MNRRSFITGLLASVAVPTLAPSGLYAMPQAIAWTRDIEEAKFLEGIAQRMVKTFIYGNPDCSPTRFRGLDSGESEAVIPGGTFKVQWNEDLPMYRQYFEKGTIRPPILQVSDDGRVWRNVNARAA